MTTAGLSELVPPDLRDPLFALRHDLHRHPELSFAEHRTADTLARFLEDVVPGGVDRVGETGVVARVPGRDPSAPVVAIRGDIDALPIQESTGVEFASVHDGVMHACGHDVHASWAVGAASLLAAEPAVGETLILLQPAEETGKGAALMLESGALDGVAAIFGAHVDLRFPLGQVVAQAGPVAAATDEFTIEIVGRGGHAARPHEAADPIVAAAAVVTALQQIVARRLPPGTPGVVTVGTIAAGTAPNVIPEHARLTGTMRAVTPDIRAALQHEVRAIATATAEAHGTRAVVTIDHGTPPIVNQAEPIAWARAAVDALLGADAVVALPAPNLGGEDFACYLETLQGCFLRIGACTPGTDPVAAHTPRFLPDDLAVLIGAAVLAQTARNASAALAGRP